MLIIVPVASAQDVNEKITVKLVQYGKLNVNAGNDVYLDINGSVFIGESIYVTGGTPEFSYMWEDDSNNLYYGPQVMVYEPGMYRLTVTDINHCTAKDSIIISDYNTDIEEEKQAELIKINKLSKNIFEIYMSDTEGPVSISVLSADGKIVSSMMINGMKTGVKHELNLSGIPSGIYLITIQNREQRVSKRIIINELYNE